MIKVSLMKLKRAFETVERSRLKKGFTTWVLCILSRSTVFNIQKY